MSMFWCVFSLTIFAVSVLFFHVYENSRAIQSAPLGGRTGTIAVTLMKDSMDVREEIHILLRAGTSLIVPQILSYLIIGIAQQFERELGEASVRLARPS